MSFTRSAGVYAVPPRGRLGVFCRCFWMPAMTCASRAWVVVRLTMVMTILLLFVSISLHVSAPDPARPDASPSCALIWTLPRRSPIRRRIAKNRHRARRFLLSARKRTGPSVSSSPSLVQGRLSHTSSSLSLVQGRLSHASSSLSLVQGRSSCASSSPSFVQGRSSHASSSPSFVQGRSSLASSSLSFVQGRSSHASSSLSFVQGRLSHASSSPSLVQGCFSPAPGRHGLRRGRSTRRRGSAALDA
jgi:hypothetical protein